MTASEKKPEDIFYKAIEIADPAKRAAYLDEACGADSKLRARVEALLAAHERAGGFLEPPAAGVTLDGPARIDGPGAVIGRYELLELLGEGGMGLVYLAEQKEPVRRKVALKIIKPGMDSKQVIARFEAERQALALLDHPNIAHVFDAGCTETGRPYFVMEYVKGLSITRYCDDNKLTIEQRLRLFEQVCEAVHHAHQKGIIHRDLKPSNILVSVHGDRAVPKIIDFGIAKAITSPLTDKTFVTFQGQLLGTPEYMSPEQVDLATQDIDTRSDIYSLGVVLYELLAGVLPFESDAFARVGLAEIQQTIREQEPASPSIRLTSLGEKAKTIAASRGTQVVPLARRLHRELEWIPLKAMRKHRCRRYRSASEMADDVHNYLTGRPLIAGPETAIYRVQKFVRKHAGSVATVALVVMAIILGLVVSTAMYLRAEDARQRETVARTRAEQAEKTTNQKAEELRRTLYVNSIQLADAKYHEGNIRHVRELLASCPNDLRGWEWNRLNYVADQSRMTLHAHDCVNAAIFSPDGKRIISGGDDGTVKIWDSSTGQATKTLAGHTEAVYSLAAAVDGRYIVSGSFDKTIKIWDSANSEEVKSMRGHKELLCAVAISPDAKLVASAAWGESGIRIWDADKGAPLMSLGDQYRCDFECVTFSPDGKRIISGDDLGNIKFWDSVSGRELRSIHAEPGVVYRLAVNPDGSRIASTGVGDTAINVWDAQTGTKVVTFSGHRERAESVAFSPDGKFIASGDRANLIKVWNAQTGGELLTLRGHTDAVSALAFSPNGTSIMSGSSDGTIKLWDVSTDVEATRLMGHPGAFGSVSMAFSPDGRRAVSKSDDGMAKVWDAKNGTEVMTLTKTSGRPRPPCVVFSLDGKLIASCRVTRTINIWNAQTGTKVATLLASGRQVWDLAFSPDNRRIVAATATEGKTWEKGAVEIWDIGKGQRVMSVGAGMPVVMSVAVSRDGKRIVSGDWDGKIGIWDATSGAEILTAAGHKGAVFRVAFSPDGKRIVSAGGGDRTVKIWDAVTGVELMTLDGHNDIVLSVSFNTDGARIISGSRDRTVKVWDVATGAELLSLRADSFVSSVAFSPDGKTVAAGAATPFAGGAVVLWGSGAPPGGYETRKTGKAATRLVDELHEDNGFYHDIIDLLQDDMGLDSAVRRLALQIANSRKWEDADKLTTEAWEAVRSADKDIEAYQVALAKAEKATGWEPNDRAILRTFAAAQYRTGAYDEALKALKRAEKLRADEGDERDAADLGFTAMSQQQLGRADEAKVTLEQLRALVKDERFAEDEEAKALLAEAERVIEGEKP